MEMKSTSRCIATDICRLLLMWEAPTICNELQGKVRYIYINSMHDFKQDHNLMLPVVLYSSINSEKPIESSNQYRPSCVHDRFRVCRSLKYYGVHVQTWIQHAKKFHSLSTRVLKGNRVSDAHLSKYLNLMQYGAHMVLFRNGTSSAMSLNIRLM
jgi:hypothetical protein